MNGIDVGYGAHSTLTTAGWFTLARIYVWGLHAWQPKTSQKPALILLKDLNRSSLHPKIVTMLLAAGLLVDIGDDLVVTQSGVDAVQERPEMMQRMRIAGVI
jgi:hypothetical protein